MSVSDEPDDDSHSRFPLAPEDMRSLAKLIEFVRKQLPTMPPVHLRSAAALLLALERLPASTPGIQMTFSFAQPNTDGNYGWADITIGEDELMLDVGEHFYDPCVGGDTETRDVFEALVGADFSRGDIEDWLPVARAVGADGNISVEDNSDYEMVEWPT